MTPNLDRLAAEGVRYTHAFATIGVCAPARSTIITGMYPPSIGTQHMRCTGRAARGRPAASPSTSATPAITAPTIPRPITTCRCTPRDLGRVEQPGHLPQPAADGQPFFAVFNFTSQPREPDPPRRGRNIRSAVADFTDAELHDPADAPVPPYHPDTPAVRRDWARYADMITYMDRQVGELLQQLEDDGLADDTIVFFYSDHGAGMPRSKRWLYDSSTRVPFMVRFPEKYARCRPRRSPARRPTGSSASSTWRRPS